MPNDHPQPAGVGSADAFLDLWDFPGWWGRLCEEPIDSFRRFRVDIWGLCKSPINIGRKINPCHIIGDADVANWGPTFLKFLMYLGSFTKPVDTCFFESNLRGISHDEP